MQDKDLGNMTTQTMYELATQPVFVDRSQEPQREVSWEVSEAGEIPVPPQLDEEKQEADTPKEVAEAQEEPKDSVEPETEEETDEPEKKKKRNRTSEKNRIAQLTRELRQAQSVAHDVLTRNQYLESKISQKEKEAFETQENYLTAQKERVKKYLADALEEGDPSKIAEANDLLSQYNTEILLTKQKQNLQPQYQQAPSYQQPYYNTPQDLPYQDAGKEWMDKNSWADKESPDFDQEMYDEADDYSIMLSKKYERLGKRNEIGSPKFLNEITSYIESQYDVSQAPPPSKPQTRERMHMKTDKSPPVGTVNRQAPLNQAPLKAKDIVLTPEQKEIAYSLRGFVKDPKTGQKIEDNRTLEEIYKRNLMKGNG